MLNQLEQKFESAFRDLYQFQRTHQVNSAHVSIGRSNIPNTYIVHFGPTQEYILSNSEIQLQPQLNLTYSQEQPKPQEDQEEYAKQQNNNYSNMPLLTADQISGMSLNQLNDLLNSIPDSQLDQEMKNELMRIRSSLAQQKKNMNMHNLSDNKNIPKNFTKAMFTYAITQRDLMLQIFQRFKIDCTESEFVDWLKVNKKSIHNIKQNMKQLRLLNSTEDKYSIPFKYMQKHFLKNNSVCYIFNSRIENTPAHLRARQSIYKALFAEQPDKQ